LPDEFLRQVRSRVTAGTSALVPLTDGTGLGFTLAETCTRGPRREA
jgi:hypothetical protein